MIRGYRLHEKLGSGGYSTVYKCTDTIGIRYACKVLPKDKTKRERITKEISIMKHMLHSPKVVRFIDACEDETSFYIIQEWCRGGSVHDYCKNFDTYGENTVSSIIRGTLRSLCHMHEKGIIHADVKAGNVLLGDSSEDADVKLCDFGTSVILYDNDFIIVDDLRGTPTSMAPENLSSKYHVASDIWSLGVMTHYLLSGSMPFCDKTFPSSPRLQEIWKNILQHQPSLQGKRWDVISEDAKDFVRICLQKNYKDRPSAYECLQHEWLRKTDCTNRFTGTPIQCKPFAYEEKAMTIIL